MYEISLISHQNLKKIVLDHTEVLRAGKYRRDDVSAFFGGYVLQIDEENLFYPQCCGDLGDIQFWRNIAAGKASYYEGHPAPIVTFRGDQINFDLTLGEFDEEFCPTPLKRTFSFSKHSLAEAISEVESTLHNFAVRIQQINLSEYLRIEKIEDLLVWECANY